MTGDDPHHEAYYRDAHGLDAEEERQVLEDFPEVERTLRLGRHGEGPPLRLRCPRGHTVITVALTSDHNGRPYLVLDPEARGRDRNRSDNVEGADPLAYYGGVHSLRVRLQCPQCRYDGRYRRTELLRVYARAALRYRDRQVKLPR